MEDIAIIGMSVRLPGADSLEAYWELIREGREQIVRHTRPEMLQRGAAAHLVDDAHWVNASAPLNDAESFDADFFGYSAREAETMDPQHRIFLECAYNGLQDSFINPTSFVGDIGVYAGTTMNTYVPYNLMANGEVYNVIGDLQTMIGNDKDYLATRVSYKLGLTGPSMSIQTACSSSLVAVHVACRALLDNECDAAIAGGSSLRMPHGAGYMANPGGTSSPDGHCRTFDVDARGSVPGSGAGVVVLKRLSDAQRDGDRIWAVIAGSAISNDGYQKASFSAPSVDGQARAASKALSRARVGGDRVSYVEAHGTGTPLGDPIEVAALSKAYGEKAPSSGRWLGSVKPNIGHLDAAAGISGLVKAVLVLHHRVVPPVVNFKSPNPHLNLGSSGFVVPDGLCALPQDGELFAAVNSVGMGGTNAHVVLRSAPSPDSRLGREDGGGVPGEGEVDLVLSAKTEKSLEAMSIDLGSWLERHPSVSLSLVEQVLQARPQLDVRQVVHAGSRAEAQRLLSRRTGRNFDRAKVRAGRRLVWLLPGQGSESPGLLGAWYGQYPRLRERIDYVTSLFEERGVIVRPYLLEDGDLEQDRSSTLAQAALFSSQWAVGSLLVEDGLVPSALLGHSLGEWSAATIAGVLSVEDAVLCIAERGREMDASADGRMLWAALSIEEARMMTSAEVSLAAENGASLVTFSGPQEFIDDLGAALSARGVPCGLLAVGKAFHSPAMSAAASAIERLMEKMTLAPPAFKIISGRTGAVLSDAEATSPEYWAQQTVETIKFKDGISAAFVTSDSGYVEFSAKSILEPLVKAADSSAQNVVGEPLFASIPEPSLSEFVMQVWLQGFDTVRARSEAVTAAPAFPPYRFERSRHWLAPRSPFSQDDGSLSRTSSAATPITTRLEDADAFPMPTQSEQAIPEEDLDVARHPISVRREVADAWKNLLGVTEISDTSNFFELGGHSLLATQLVVQLRRALGVEIPMVTVFESPAFGDFLVHVEGLASNGAHETENKKVTDAQPLVVAKAPELPDRLGELKRRDQESDVDFESRVEAIVSRMSDREAAELLASLEDGEQ